MTMCCSVCSPPPPEFIVTPLFVTDCRVCNKSAMAYMYRTNGNLSVIKRHGYTVLIVRSQQTVLLPFDVRAPIFRSDDVYCARVYNTALQGGNIIRREKRRYISTIQRVHGIRRQGRITRSFHHHHRHV